ncbi:MAG: AGE family epimerase/isomerase, partial [Pseudomonadota bacterium]
HGLAFLTEGHRQPDGGYAWVLNGLEVQDGTRHCYGHAFVLLAAAGAAKAGVESARELAGDTYDLLEQRFFEPSAGLYVDEIASGDWAAIDPYRGQNCNMHMCEAMLAAFEATGEARYLDRADGLAKRICVELTEATDGLVWEHYHTDWTHDWDYNRDDPKNLFRPYGYLPGHFTEWTKLLLILERHRPEDWMATRAQHLFDTALAKSWDDVSPGMNYTFGPDGTILDTDRYYWVIAETFAAAAALALRTGDDRYWEWYDRVWAYGDAHFVDHAHGAWYRVLNRKNRRYDDLKSPPSKTDYHPLAACFETLEAMRHAAA